MNCEVLIKPLSENRLQDAAAFLFPHEAECVNLCEIVFNKNAENCYIVEKCDEGGAAEICGMFCFRKHRTVFHCLPFAKYKTASDKALCQIVQPLLYEFFENEKPFCINGESCGSLFLKNILKNKKLPINAKVTNEYFLMVCQEKGVMEQKSEVGGVSVYAASLGDFEKLFPLELAYQKEEVIPKNFLVEENVIKAAFKINLQRQKIFALDFGGETVAKAAITAQGKNYVLLGGVFTKPEFRGRGFAKKLMERIFEEAAALQKNLALYVKKKNIAAVELYKNLGFEKADEYRLIYF